MLFGYFNQNFFKYIKNCEVPSKGFDVIFTDKNGNKIYAEIKNKHNTTNDSSSKKIYLDMDKKIKNDSKCICYLVEVISKTSRDIVWEKTIDKKKYSNKRIRRISMDRFYEIVTGDKNAFHKICIELPAMVDEIVKENPSKVKIEKDTALDELKRIDKDLIKALYYLAFKDYYGFIGE